MPQWVLPHAIHALCFNHRGGDPVLQVGASLSHRVGHPLAQACDGRWPTVWDVESFLDRPQSLVELPESREFPLPLAQKQGFVIRHHDRALDTQHRARRAVRLEIAKLGEHDILVHRNLQELRYWVGFQRPDEPIRAGIHSRLIGLRIVPLVVDLIFTHKFLAASAPIFSRLIIHGLVFSSAKKF